MQGVEVGACAHDVHHPNVTSPPPTHPPLHLLFSVPFYLTTMGDKTVNAYAAIPTAICDAASSLPREQGRESEEWHSLLQFYNRSGLNIHRQQEEIVSP
jgi:hypothetical protein